MFSDVELCCSMLLSIISQICVDNSNGNANNIFSLFGANLLLLMCKDHTILKDQMECRKLKFEEFPLQVEISFTSRN